MANKNSNETVIIVAPCLELKDQWLKKLRRRYEQTGLEKDKFALLNAEQCFEENIAEMHDCAAVFPFFETTTMDYKLKYLFANFLKDDTVLETFGFRRWKDGL